MNIKESGKQKFRFQKANAI